MWSFYDELYIGIPSGIRVEGCVVGRLWTTVRANGNIGVARTLGDTSGDLAALGQSMIGQFLRDAANVLRWDSLLRASIGVAAMNAFYNTAERVKALGAPGTFEDARDGGKTTAVIGALPKLEASLNGKCALTVLPLPERGELGGEYAAALRSDFVFISGDALTDRTLPALLAGVGEGTKVSLTGVSVPAAPVLFAFGNPIHNLSGVYSRCDTTVEAAARQDLPDVSPGTLPFSIDPIAPAKLHSQG